MLTKLKNIPITLIFFESANRIEDCLADLLSSMGDRDMALTRELTKMFEEVWRGSVSQLLARVQNDGQPKGEIVLVIEGVKEDAEQLDVEAILKDALEHNSLKDAVALVTGRTGLPKKEVYHLALEIQKK